MSRKNRGPSQRQLTIYLEPELMYDIDNYMVGLGLDSRASAVVSLVRAGMSSMPLESMLGSVLQQCVKEMKREEFQALADHYAQRAVLMQSAVLPPGQR